jgi:hypothetical protein
MKQPQVVAYCNLMEDIKTRISVVNNALDPDLGDMPWVIRLEVVYLQYRKILEEIAFGTLISNHTQFSVVFKNFSKYWNAADLLRDVAKVNPDFYPRPVVQVASATQGVDGHLEDRAKDYLTKDEFLTLYGRCGDILHERNPFSGKNQDKWYLDHAPEWREKITALLNSHLIRLSGDPNLYLVHMAGPDGKAHHYTFSPKPEVNRAS